MKIGLIVDNPQRDLPGTVALAVELLNNNLKPYLIPGNLRSYEAGKIKPEYILLPNLRWPYVKLAKFLKNNGVRVGVIESEGGFVNQTSDLLQTYDRNINYDNLVDDWFFWGPKFKNSFIEHLGLNRDQCHVVGNPKFDLYKLKKKNKFKKKILIATGFPFYNNILGKEETWNSEKKHNISEKDLKRDYANQKKQFSEAIKFIKDISGKYPDYEFVIRPHPFERLQSYTEELNFKNITIDNSKFSHQELSETSLLIHFISSLAYESSLYNLNNIAIKNMIPKNTINSDNPLLEITRFAENKEELIKNLENYINFKNDSNISLEKYVYYDNKVTSSELISSVISKNRMTKVNKNQMDKLIYGFISNENLSYPKYQLRRIFNIKLKYRLNLQNRVKNWKKSFKHFSLQEVESVIADLGSNVVLNYFDKDRTSIELQSEK